MVTLKCLASGSSGNCYSLTDSNGKILLLDLGIPKKDIVRGINYKISDVVGCVVSHIHTDHSKSVKDLKKSCIDVYTPYESQLVERKMHKFGNFTVYPIPMLDKTMTTWQHTNADGSECSCYGFLIENDEMGKLLYITDTKLITWNFAKQRINHILIGTNYDENMLASDESKRKHVLTGHLSLKQSCEFVRANATSSLRNVIMCHLSGENSEPEHFINEMKKVVKNANVNVAKARFEVDVNEIPF